MMRYLLFILALTLCGTASGDELEDALYRRVVVWETPSGKKVTIAHCGRGEGCKERISAFAGWIESAAAIYQIDQWILGGMAFHESGLNPFAKGSIGERGILQLHPKGVGRSISGLLFLARRRRWDCATIVRARRKVKLANPVCCIVKRLFECGGFGRSKPFASDGWPKEHVTKKTVIAHSVKLGAHTINDVQSHFFAHIFWHHAWHCTVPREKS